MSDVGKISVFTHLCLVHDQLLPTLTPALDPRLRPAEVVLLVSPPMECHARRTARLLRDSGVRVSEWPLADPWDVGQVRQRVNEFLAARPDENIVLNVSGGTRPMSLGAYEVFRQAGRPIYYVHPHQDRLIWLHPQDREPFDLADRIRLPAFLAARDLRLVSAVRQGIAEPLRELTSTLVRQVDRFSAALAKLNWYAASAKRESLLSMPLHGSDLQTTELRELLDLFSSNRLLTVTAEGRLLFASEAARFYANGGWLEEYIFSLLQQLRKELPLQDLARNLVVEWDEQGSPVRNEIDVAFVANNRFCLIECKTKRFQGESSPEADLSATLYKLDTLRDYLGGEGARAMLVSYRPLDRAGRERAREFGIEVFEGAGVQALNDSLKLWLNVG